MSKVSMSCKRSFVYSVVSLMVRVGLYGHEFFSKSYRNYRRIYNKAKAWRQMARIKKKWKIKFPATGIKQQNWTGRYNESANLQRPLHLSKQWPRLGLKCSNARVNGSHFSFNPPTEYKVFSCSSSPSVSLCCVCNCMHA